MPAAAELLGDRADVRIAFRSHADAVLLALDLLEEDDRLNFFHGQREVDEAFGVFVRAAGLARHLVIEVHDRNPTGGVELHRAQHRAEQLEPAQVVGVVHVAGDEHRVDARFERLSTDVEGARGDARIVKRSGVGQDGEIDVRGDVDRQLDAERADEVEHHLAAGCRRGVEPVQLAIPGVAGMMVDVDDEEPIEARDAGPRQIAAFHDDRGVEVAFDVVGNLDLGHAPERHQRRRRRVAVDDMDVLAERAQRVSHGELGADRVAVGSRVRRQDETPPGNDRIGHLSEFGRRLVFRGHHPHSFAGPQARRLEVHPARARAAGIRARGARRCPRGTPAPAIRRCHGPGRRRRSESRSAAARCDPVRRSTRRTET